MIQTQPFEVNDFSGGITDNYIEGRRNQAKEYDNILLSTNKKPFSREGSELLDINNPQVPNGQQRVNALIAFDESTLMANSLKKVYYLDGSWSEITGPSGNGVLTDGDGNSNTSFTRWNDHIFITNDSYSKPMKIYRDNGGNIQLRNAGLPGLASDPSIVIGTAGALGYIYAFAYYYEYQSGQKTFVDIGPTKQVRITNSSDPGSSSNTVNGIPTLSNGSTDNFDTTNIKVKIYRTVGDGDVLYEIGEVNNGTSSFIDNNADADIQQNVTIYTTGGVLDNDEPPRCKYVHVTNSLGIYANIQVDGEIFKNRVLLSVYNDPDSVPNGNIIDVDDEITGVSSVEHIPVIFCKRHIYRVDGFYSETGGGSPLHQRISDTVGCVSNTSIVQTDFGTFFAGNDGFYWTDSYKVLKVSNEFNDRYKNFVNNNTRIYGTYDEENSRVYWSAQRDAANSDVDSCFVLDLRFGVKPDSCFTTLSGGDNFSPTSMIFFQKEWVRADKRGYIFHHNKNLLTDPIINTVAAPSTWKETTIIWDYESCAFNFGTTFMRKWITRMNAVLQNETNLSLGIFSINDDGRRTAELAPIRFRGNVIWGDEDVVWGDGSVIWNYDGFIDEFRRFPAKNLRCNYKQVRMTNGFVTIYNSDTYGDGVVNNSAKTVTLSGSGEWPSKAVDYQIFFESDGYTRGYLITDISTNVLTYSDSGNESPTGTQKWIIKGQPKGEVFSLIAYVLHYAIISKTQQGFRSSGTGDNG